MNKISVRTSLNVYFKVLKVFGLFPFDLQVKGLLYEYRINSLLIIWSIIVFGVLIVASICPFLILEVNTDLEFEIWKIVADLGVVMNTIQFLHQCTKYKTFVKLIEQFENLDKKALQNGIFMNSYNDKKRITRIIIYPIIIVTLYCNLVHLGQVYTLGGFDILNTYLMITLTISQSFQIFYASQFIIFTSLLKKRFSKLDNYLKFSLEFKQFDTRRCKIAKFCEMFSLLCSLVKTVNEISSSNLIFTFIYVLMHNIFTSYGIVKSLYIDKDMFDLISNLLWFAMTMSMTLFTCWSGDSVRSAADESQNYLIKQLMRSKDDIYKNELLILHYQLKNHNKNVGNIFFNINFKLILAVS
jgi:hypothetical protein